jgi:hypothetical protein
MPDQYANLPPLEAKRRLEYLRSQIDAECISMSEISELQNLVPYIDPTDVVLLQWAGVPEFPPSWLVKYDVPIVFTVVSDTPEEAESIAETALRRLIVDIENEYNVEADFIAGPDVRRGDA